MLFQGNAGLPFEVETLEPCLIQDFCKSFHICQRKGLPEAKPVKDAPLSSHTRLNR